MRLSFWPNPTQPYSDVLQLARHVESTGWDGIWYADHFMPNAEDVHGDWYECWTVLAALAGAVPRLRLGPLVTGNTYRHPAVLAKMATTVDHISGGRVVLGLGAGWQENEHRAYGIEFSDVPGRLARLREACAVIRSLREQHVTDFEGQHYTLRGAPLEPKPVGSLPLMIGGGGEKVTLRIVAELADEWNVWGDVATLVHKMEILNGHCAAVGRDPAAIERSAVALLFMSDEAAWLEKIRASPVTMPRVVGRPEEVAEVICAYRDAGVDEFIVPDFNLGGMDQKVPVLDRFIETVGPRVR